MKRHTIMGLLILLISTPMFATTLDDVVNEALKNSTTIESAKNTLSSNQLTAQLLLVEDNASFSISSGDLTWGTDGVDTSYKSNYTLNPNLTIYLNDDNETSIKAMTHFNIEEGVITGENFSTAISSTIDLNDKDLSDDLNSEMNLYNATYIYNNSLLTVQGQIYSYIKNILAFEKNLLDAKSSLSIYQTDYENAIAIGTYSKGDVDEKMQLSKIQSQSNLVEQYEKNIKLTKQQFQSYTGIAYTQLDNFDEIELSINANLLNSPIKVADCQTKIYEEELRILKQDTNKIALNGGGDSKIDSDNSDLASVSINGDATYSVNNFSFSGGAKGTWEWETGNFTPYVSASITYTSDSTTSKDELQIQSMLNKIQSSSLNYLEKLSSHTLNVFSFQNDIQIANLELQQLTFDKNVNLMNLDNQQILYNNGLLTKTNLEESNIKVQIDLLEEEILKLDRIILQNNIDKEFL